MVSMYHFDDTHVAKLTMQKLIAAAQRGIQVNLLHDVITSDLDPELEDQFHKAGGRSVKLGEM